MPNVTAAATLSYTAGALRSNRLKPARMRYTGGTFTTLSDTPVTTPATIPVLDRLTRWEKPPGYDAQAWERQQAIWQKAMGAIEDAFVAVNARVDEVALYARLNAVETLAQAANDNATTAQTQVTQVSAAVETTFTQIDPAAAETYRDGVEDL